MAATAEIVDTRFEETVGCYDVGVLERSWLAARGTDSNSFFLQTTADGHTRQFVLTVFESAVPDAEEFVQLLEICCKAGLPVAPVIRSRTGKSLERHGDKQGMLCPRLPGRHVSNPTFRQCEAVGRLLARLHLATRRLGDTMPQYPRDADWLARRAHACEGRVPYSQSRLIHDTLAFVADLLGRRDVAQMPSGVIHGDLCRDRVLFTERSLAGVSGLQHASTGYWLYDLAAATNDWCNDARGVLDPDRVWALIRAYHRVRPLTRQEIWFYPAFTVYAGFASWLYQLAAALSPNATARGNDQQIARTKNPGEFHNVVMQNSAHFLYLDERLL